MNSTFFYNLASFGYIFTFFIYAFHLLKTKDFVLRFGIFIKALSFFLHTLGLLFRWIEAGKIEVLSFEKAQNVNLEGLAYWIVFSQHPPWSNLYEIMVYMAWGVILASLIAEMLWSVSWLRQASLLIAILALGIASLTDSSIKPLVPALKSFWIMIHVISASLAYSFGTLGAFACLLALVKDRQKIAKEKFFAFALCTIALLIFFVGGGINLLLSGQYFVKVLSNSGINLAPVFDLAGENKALYAKMPYVGSFMIISIGVHLFAAIRFYVGKVSGALLLSSFFTSVLVLSFMIFYSIFGTNIDLNKDVLHHLSEQGPYVFSFSSHTYSFWLMVFTCFMELFFIGVFFKENFVSSKLPFVESLDLVSYKTISVCFFLMSIVLMTGCLWAHYAWGRYWAWDPKETGALAIWINNAIFLHARRTHGLSGGVTSLIGILGFFVILVGFLGVNLGLFANGLHSYGSN